MKVFRKIKMARISLFIIMVYYNCLTQIKGEHYNIYISFLSKITIKINSSGNQNIFYSSFNNYPDLVLINNNNQLTNINSNILNLNESSNVIELTWNNDLSTCEKMFYKCNKIAEVDLSQFNGTNVVKYNNMFEDCLSLTSINISNLDTSLAIDMSYMFLNCSNIISLDLSIFNTQSVTTMTYMFSGCKSLKYLNISNFNTSKVKNMTQMFHNCRALISLDLSNFYTPVLQEMSFMFAECQSLEYLNINNFNTSNVEQIRRVFYNCKSLISLNLSSFNTSKIIHMISVFSGCEKLISLDVSSFNVKILRNANGLFQNCKSITSLNLSNFIASSLNDIAHMFLNDNNLKYLDISNFDTSSVTDMTNLFSNCWSLKTIDISNFNTPKTKLMKQMFQDCKSLVYLNLSNFDTSLVTDMTNMFKNCENLKYINLKNSKSSSSLIISDIFANTPEKMIFCIDESKNQKLYEEIINNKANSTINCSDYAYIYILETTFPTTIPKTFPTTIPSTVSTIIPESIIIIKTIINQTFIIEKINNDCSFNDTCLLENITNNEELYNLIINNILKAYSNDEDNIIEGKDNIIFQLTNNKNQLNILNNKTLINNNQNLSIIDLAKCEDILKKEYNINPNDSLIILKQENISTNLKSSEKNIKYEVFEPYNKTKLNLSLCEGTNINLYTKMTLSDKTKRMYERLKALGYDMFNINDKFYQDICTPYKTEDSTDILLTDRIDFIYNNDDAQCQTNCQFSEYLLDTQYISCECSLDGNIQKNRIDKFNAKKIYESFYEVLKYSNYQVFKCYKLVFSKKILENIGGIIIFLYFCINIGCFVFYLIKKDISLKNEILKYNNLNKDNNDIKKVMVL